MGTNIEPWNGPYGGTNLGTEVSILTARYPSALPLSLSTRFLACVTDVEEEEAAAAAAAAEEVASFRPFKLQQEPRIRAAAKS